MNFDDRPEAEALAENVVTVSDWQEAEYTDTRAFTPTNPARQRPRIPVRENKHFPQ